MIPARVGTGNLFDTKVLLDTGASGKRFMDLSFALRCSFPVSPFPNPIPLTNFEGIAVQFQKGFITHVTKADLRIGDHTEKAALFLLTSLPQYPVVLGTPWFKEHQPELKNMWSGGPLVLSSDHCQHTCLNEGIKHCEVPLISNLSTSSSAKMDIAVIGAEAFAWNYKQKGARVHAISLHDIEKTLSDKVPTDPSTKLPDHYSEFLDVFDRKESERLPPHRPFDHKIPLLPGSALPNGPIYGMGRDELLVLKKTLHEHLSKGFIRASTSPVSLPVLFARKQGGGLRLCMDYRKLNAITVKSRYPIPLIRETLDRLGKARVFSKFDVIAAFNRIRIAEGDEYLTAFKTIFGLFEWLVMPFGLVGAPGTWQHFMNDNFREYLDVFTTIYLDDILVYSDSLREHREHVRTILQRCREIGVTLDIDKCEFETQEVVYLGLIISTNGIRMDPTKVAAIQLWEVPKTAKEVRCSGTSQNVGERVTATGNLMDSI